jgi:hypothetical protein
MDPLDVGSPLEPEAREEPSSDEDNEDIDPAEVDLSMADDVASLSEESGNDIDMTQPRKRARQKCWLTACEFCTGEDCGQCFNCKNPQFKNKCLSRDMFL